MAIDATTAALIGAGIGGLTGVLGTAITGWAASRRERKAFQRATSLQHVDRVRETYEAALNVFFNLNRSGSPDRASAYLEVPPHGAKMDLPKLIDAMKQHVSELETRMGAGQRITAQGARNRQL